MKTRIVCFALGLAALACGREAATEPAKGGAGSPSPTPAPVTSDAPTPKPSAPKWEDLKIEVVGATSGIKAFCEVRDPKTNKRIALPQGWKDLALPKEGYALKWRLSGAGLKAVTYGGETRVATKGSVEIEVDLRERLGSVDLYRAKALKAIKVEVELDLEAAPGKAELVVSVPADPLQRLVRSIKEGPVTFARDRKRLSRDISTLLYAYPELRPVGRSVALRELDLIALTETRHRDIRTCHYRNQAGDKVKRVVQGYDAQVTVYERRTGKKRASRLFKAKDPGCKQSVKADDVQASWQQSPAIEKWLLRQLAPDPEKLYAAWSDKDDTDADWVVKAKAKPAPKKAQPVERSAKSEAIGSFWSFAGLSPKSRRLQVIRRLGKPARREKDDGLTSFVYGDFDLSVGFNEKGRVDSVGTTGAAGLELIRKRKVKEPNLALATMSEAQLIAKFGPPKRREKSALGPVLVYTQEDAKRDLSMTVRITCSEESGTCGGVSVLWL